MVTVYLLHYSGKYYHCRHYIGGTTKTVEERLKEHVSGHGNGLVYASIKAGLEVIIARVWNNVGWEKEKELKRQKNASRFCPICQKKLKST